MANRPPGVDLSRLIAQARGGDVVAIEGLIERIRPYLTLLARMKRNRSLQAKYDDSDLVQETLLRIHQNVAEFRGTTDGELAAWLRKIMANVYAQQARHYSAKRRDTAIERKLQDQFADSSRMAEQLLSASLPSPSQQASRREDAVALSHALMRIAPDYREALILHQLEGFTVRETAECMGRSVDSVQKLLARGLLELRRLLGEHR